MRAFVTCSLGLFAAAGLSLILLFAAVRAAPSSGLVYSQFTEAGGRAWIYLDPFRGRQFERSYALHNEAAVKPLETSPRSPDGTRQVMPRITADGVDLFVVALDGSEIQLTSASVLAPTGEPPFDRRSNTFPLWSPDGQWISFISANAQARMDLYVIRADGSQLRRVSEAVRTPMPLGLRWLALPEANFQPWLAMILLGGLAGLAWLVRDHPAG